MVPDTSTTIEPSPRNDRSAVVNGLVGGIAGILLSFIPLSPILGGAIAGYLEGGSTEDGLAVGTVAGLVMLLPYSLMFFFLFFVLGFVGFGGAPSVFGVLILFVLFFAALYTVGLGLLGGVLGVYLGDEF